MMPAIMDETRTTVVVQRFLDELAGIKGDTPAEPIVRALLASAVDRLQVICSTLLFLSYPRLTKPPLNLQADEMLSAVVERLIKAMRAVHPQTVRQFFALANQHVRWELNDLARRLDKEAHEVALRESLVGAPPDSLESQLSPTTLRILDVIEHLPEEEREAFDLVKVQGMSQPDAAEVIGVSPKTVQRRLNRALLLLSDKLGDLQPTPRVPPELA